MKEGEEKRNRRRVKNEKLKEKSGNEEENGKGKVALRGINSRSG